MVEVVCCELGGGQGPDQWGAGLHGQRREEDGGGVHQPQRGGGVGQLAVANAL